MDKYNVEVYLDVKKLDERKEEEETPNNIISSSGFPIRRLNLCFKCKTEIRLIKVNKTGVFCRGTLPLMVNSFQLDYDQQEVMPYAKTYSTICTQVLKDWPHQCSDQMIARVMWRIWDMVQSVSHSNNVLDIAVEVVVNYQGSFRKSTEMLPLCNGFPLFQMDVENASEISHTADDDEEDCPICLQGLFGYGRAAIYLKCLHAFHVSCIFKWAREKGTCPICRYNLPPIPKT